jgi:hypothetical protein
MPRSSPSPAPIAATLAALVLVLAACGGASSTDSPIPRPTPPPALDERAAEQQARSWLAVRTGTPPGDIKLDHTGIPDGVDRLWWAQVLAPEGIYAVCVDLDSKATMVDKECEDRLVTARTTPDPGVLAPPALALLDVLDPGEVASATVSIAESAEADVVARAQELGFEVMGPIFGQITVDGPAADLRRLAEAEGVLSLSVSERREALRPAAPPRESFDIPVPGRPYDTLPAPGVEIEQWAVHVDREHRDRILALIAPHLVSLSGQPYDHAWAGIDCDEGGGPPPVRCRVMFMGRYHWTSDLHDGWEFRVSAERGWVPEPNLEIPPTYGAMPRWLAREAERIARADPGAASRIGTYELIEDFAWHPRDPGIVDVRYSRHMAEARLPGHVAEVGWPKDFLIVEVDVAAGRVRDLREVLAQPGA